MVAGPRLRYQISAINMDATEEGARYTPAGAGIKIDDTHGSTNIVITQVQSEAAAVAGLTLATAGKTLGMSCRGRRQGCEQRALTTPAM